MMGQNHIGEIISIIFMAFALGMDVFSLSLGMGMQHFRLKRIAIIGFVFGLFHLLLPFLGIMIGKLISAQLTDFATLVGGLLMVGIGIHMILSVFSSETRTIIRPFGFGLFILGLSVSIDSFSVGLSLGISGVKTALTLILFGIVSMVLTWIGMLLGRKVRGYLGSYSEILGGSILCAFGLKIIFG